MAGFYKGHLWLERATPKGDEPAVFVCNFCGASGTIKEMLSDECPVVYDQQHMTEAVVGSVQDTNQK